MEILQIQALSLTLGDKKIIDRLSLELWDGHVHAVIGPNGAGKSTLASVIMGLSGYRDIQGEILFAGQSITGLTVAERAARGITLAWQEPARYEGLSVNAFIRAAAKSKTQAEVDQALVQVGLDPAEYGPRRVDKTLSGGERKKIELASILVMHPRLVFLDEPDSGIDVESLDRIFEAIRILKAMNATVVLITHSLAVLKQADHAFLMCNGTLIDKGRAEVIAGYFENKCLGCTEKNPVEKGEA